MKPQDPQIQRMALEAAHVKELVGSQMWAVYARHLSVAIDEATSRLKRGTRDNFDYHRGVMDGLEQAMGLPQMIQDAYDHEKRSR